MCAALELVRVAYALRADMCALRARCGRAGAGMRPGASGYLRAHEGRSEFRSESARGLDPFSARQLPALPI